MRARSPIHLADPGSPDSRHDHVRHEVDDATEEGEDEGEIGDEGGTATGHVLSADLAHSPIPRPSAAVAAITRAAARARAFSGESSAK